MRDLRDELRGCVLVLEDSPPDARFLVDALRAGGFESVLCGTLAEVRVRLAADARRYVAGLIDLCVPDSRGLATVRAVREAAPHLPIVVQSALDDEEVAVEAVACGAQDYLLKDALTERRIAHALRYAIERQRLHEALRESEERYALAMRGANDGLWDWDLTRGSIHVSLRWREIMGFEPGESAIDPEAWIARVDPVDRARVAAALKEHIDGRSRAIEVEYRVLGAGGTMRWVLCRGVARRDEDGTALRVAGSLTDITRRKHVEALLQHEALHDALTGLPNRTLFDDRLQQAFRRLRRDGRGSFAVLFVDLDRFKLVNDSLGHAAGDALIVETARRLRQSVRPADTVARLGGDEFALLLEGLGCEAEADRVARRIHDQLRRPIPVDGQEVYSGCSIGIAHGHSDYRRPQDVVRDADVALYQAKARGGGCTVRFDPDRHGGTRERLRLETDLRRALDRGEIAVHFQPIVSLETMRVVGFEALARWQRPGHGPIPPDRFIPVAEETGLIVPLGYRVLRVACWRMARWNRILFAKSPRTVSVNLSPRQLLARDFVDHVDEILAETGLPASCLAFEITEGLLLRDTALATSVLDALRSRGVRIDIDDFGTGYSALAYLRRYPVDRLKIDRTFVGGMTHEAGDLEVVRAILGMAHALGIAVVAEGIETADQLAQLRQLRCEYGQGYLLGRPSAYADDQPALRRAAG